MHLKVGAIVEGKVKNIAKFGAFINLGEGKIGLVHISEVSNSYIKEIGDCLKEGQTVKVKIIKLNDKGQFELSIKQANEEESDSFANEKNSGFKSTNQSLSFEDMLNKFKKLSEEKLSGFKKRNDVKRTRNTHKGNN